MLLGDISLICGRSDTVVMFLFMFLVRLSGASTNKKMRYKLGCLLLSIQYDKMDLITGIAQDIIDEKATKVDYYAKIHSNISETNLHDIVPSTMQNVSVLSLSSSVSISDQERNT